MALNEQFLEEEIHPIDIVEHIAEHHEWEFDRMKKIKSQWPLRRSGGHIR